MKTNGIDVSKHQGGIDWGKVKAAGVGFAIIRAGFGRDISQKDPNFETNYAGCKANGIPCGVYWYSYAMTPADAKKEAAACLEAIKGKKLEYPVYFDIEEKSQLALGKAACTKIARAFLEAVEAAGYWVGIYSSKSHLETCIAADVRNRYAVWVAHYGVNKTTYSGQHGMWQKSDKGKIDGIRGNVDLNVCYVDYPAKIKAAGLNGYEKGEAEKEKPAKAVVHTVKKGDTLGKIAAEHDSSVSAIVAANKKKHPRITPNYIQVGWALEIPV